MRMGEWKIVESGRFTKVREIGYISNMANFTHGGLRIELTKVASLVGTKLVWKKKTKTYYGAEDLRPADGLLDLFQDHSALIELALQTKDKEWFEEISGIPAAQVKERFSFHEEQPAFVVDETPFKKELIELALLTKDEKWFRELMQQ